MAKATKRRPAPEKPVKTRKCVFCSKKGKLQTIDYKDTALLRTYISERGKIRARRVTGNCVQHQRDIAVAVKNAREVALLPFIVGDSLRTEIPTMKLILTAEVDHLGPPATPSRSRTATAVTTCCPVAWPSRPPVARSVRPTTSAAPSKPRPCATSTHANELKTAHRGLGAVSLAVKTAGGLRQAVRFGHRGRRRRRHQEGRRTESGQADRAAAQGAHQVGRHPPGRGAPAPRRQRVGFGRRRCGVSTHAYSSQPTPRWKPLAAITGVLLYALANSTDGSVRGESNPLLTCRINAAQPNTPEMATRPDTPKSFPSTEMSAGVWCAYLRGCHESTTLIHKFSPSPQHG